MKVYSFGCQDAFPNKLSAPAFLVQEGKELILVDCPPQINVMLRQAGFSPMDLTAIFITHLHNDHVGGLIELIQLRTLCLQNPELMRNAGYFTSIACVQIPIHILGFDPLRWDALEALIGSNCSDKLRVWRNYHQIEFHGLGCLAAWVWSGTVFFGGHTRIDMLSGVHDTVCCGLKFGNGLAISGDTTYDSGFLRWLTRDVKLVFHEAGYAGSHTKREDWPKVAASHPRLYFYHIPWPVIPLLKGDGFRPVRRGWYKV